MTISNEVFEKYLKEYEGTIIKTSNRIAKSKILNVDEAKSLVQLALYNTILNWDGKRSKFITYFYKNISYEYIRTIKELTKNKKKDQLIKEKKVNFSNSFDEIDNSDFIKYCEEEIKNKFGKNHTIVFKKMLKHKEVKQIAKELNVSYQYIYSIKQEINYTIKRLINEYKFN